MQDPEAYLNELGLKLPCPVRRDLDAVIDVEHRAFVNHETFFFSSLEALEDFRARPLRYLDRVTDPVRNVRFAPSERSRLWVHDDRPYYFLDETSLVAFKRNPDLYADPKRAM